ncbi:MAG TPA: ISL3 family transposase [Flavisolibacter sp.]|nr:ISL3 family transposase [Flavisolibacter sp.]
MLSKNIVFDKADSFSIVLVEKSDCLVTIHIKSKQQKSRCPVCRTNSKSIHSHYQRTIKELPAFCNSVQFHLAVRRFYFHNKTCNRKIFAERFKDHFTPYGRVSKRLEEKLLKVALLMGGNPGEKLCRSLNIDRSSSSLIRLIHKQKLYPVQTVITLGIDDWARRKRVTYGTCLVDLDRHKMIELLEDREPVTVENWLKNHPEVRIASRDRFLNYAKGIAAGAPDAIQVTDRWHLLKNLGDDLQKVVERNHQQLKYARKKEIRRLQRASVKQICKKTSSVNQVNTQNFSRRQWQLEQIKKLQSEGAAIKAIARELKMSRNTVKKYMYFKEPPRRKSTVQVNIALFDTYNPNKNKERAQYSTDAALQRNQTKGI